MRRLRYVACAIAIVATSLLALAIPSSAVAAAGDLYVTDLATNSVIIYNHDGTASTFATGFSSPQGLAFDTNKNLYVADGGTGNIFLIAPDGTKTVFAAAAVTTPAGISFNGRFAGADLLVS